MRHPPFSAHVAVPSTHPMREVTNVADSGSKGLAAAPACVHDVNDTNDAATVTSESAIVGAECRMRLTISPAMRRTHDDVMTKWSMGKVEPGKGFEPLTYALRMRCSTN